MLEATLVTMGWAVSNWLIAGVHPQPMGNENMTAAPRAFRTGRGLLNIAANKQEQFEALCRLVGRPELIADPRFADREDRKRRVRAEGRARAGARPAPQEWSALLNEAGVPGRRGPSSARGAGAPAGGRARAGERFRRAGRRAAVAVVRAGFRLASGDPEPRTPPPPALGADTGRILGELGWTAATRSRARGAEAI